MTTQIDQPTLPHPVLGCVETIAAALDYVADLDASYLTGAQKRSALLGLTTQLGRVEELRLRVLAAGQALGDVAADDASRDAAAWLAHHAHLDRGKARHLTRLATHLTDSYPALGAALRAGQVDLAQAEVIARALGELPDDLDPTMLQLAEETLIAQAATFNPRDLRTLGRRVLAHIAPDIADDYEARALADEEAHAHQSTFARFHRRGDGTTDLHARLADSVAERLQRYLHAYTSPRHADHPTANPETNPETNPEANPASSSGTNTAGAACVGESPGTPDPTVPVPQPQAGSARQSDESAGGPAGAPDRRPYDQRLGHALGSLLEHLDPRRLPIHGGDATTVIVTIDHHTLINELRGSDLTGAAGVALCGDQPITAAQARRLACTANILPAVLSGDSHVLDLGRTRRLFNPTQRKALMIQFPHCAAVGCDIPAPWCEAHHSDTPWALGGNTDLAHGALLCSHHHHRAHDPHYQTTRRSDGIHFHRRI